MFGRALPTLFLLATVAASADADQRDPRLPGLFRELQATADAAEGKRLGREIAAIWAEARDQGVREMMEQGHRFVAAGDLNLALGNFTSVTNFAPDFAEGWNQRAKVLYRLGNHDKAIRTIRQTLRREPRHFLAWSGLGAIYLELDRKQDALTALHEALAINPHLEGAKYVAGRLRRALGAK